MVVGWQGVAGRAEEACVCLPPISDGHHRGKGEASAARHADAGHLHSRTLRCVVVEVACGCATAVHFLGATAYKPHRQCSARICAQVYQRQLSKEGLQALVNNAAGGGAVGSAAEDDAPAGAGGGPNIQSAEDLRDLFTLRSSTLSDVRFWAKVWSGFWAAIFLISHCPRLMLVRHDPHATICYPGAFK